MYLKERNDAFNVNKFNYVIIDTDGGGDDCQAILLLDYLIKKQGKTLLGIVCTSGNVTVKDIQKNVLICQSICQSKYPVYKGTDFALSGDLKCIRYFGEDGLGEMQSEYLKKFKIDNQLVQKQKAYKFIAESAIKYKGDISIICIGPLTNLALAYLYNNQIKDCFSNISIMGCADSFAGFYQAYLTQFNIGFDPQASYIVFNVFGKHLKLTIVSFDTTCSNVQGQQFRALYEQINSVKGKFIHDIHQHLIKQKIVPPVVDPLAVLALFMPETVEQGLNVNIKIMATGKRTAGMSLINYFSSFQQSNCYLIKNINFDRIMQQISNSYK